MSWLCLSVQGFAGQQVIGKSVARGETYIRHMAVMNLS